MTRKKKKKVPDRLKLISVDTHSDVQLRNTEDIFQKAEEFRQAADTLLRLQLARSF